MEFIFYIFIFIFGLVIGSFLNVVIFRMETNEGIVRGRSHCRKCRKDLAWYDLVPLFSFIALGGKCRNCRKKISIQYPLVELATALLFVLVFDFSASGGSALDGQFSISLFYYLFIISALIVIFVYDLKHYIIPDKIVYSAIGASAVYRMFGFLEFDRWDFIGNWKLEIGNLITLFNPFIAAVAASAFFLVIVLLTRGEGMGGGDIKLAFLMGLFLGIDKILISLAIAFTLGAIIGIILIILKKKTLKSAIPFGPFLAIGTIIGLFI